jgi:hypothetical protein
VSVRRTDGNTRAARLAFATLLGWLCTAPTPGDIGGCGQAPQELDPVIFFERKQHIDCDHCRQCGIVSQRCDRLCDSSQALPDEFPAGCRPLVHDGEVCLRALEDASCAEYRQYMDEEAPRVPSECNFCPPRGQP